MRISEIINEGYKEVKQKFISSNPNIDENDIDAYLSKFKDLVKRNQFQGNEKNIDYWGKQGFEPFRNVVNKKSEEKSKTQKKRSKVKGENINVAENDKWLIVVPLDKDASCFYGKNTDWCTTKPSGNYFKEYFHDKNITLIYFIRKEDLNKWAIAVYPPKKDKWWKFTKNKNNENYSAEFFDINDNQMSQNDFESETKLNADKFIQMAVDTNSDNYKKQQDKRMDHKKSEKQIHDKMKNVIKREVKKGEPNEKIEKELIELDSKELANIYMNVVKKSDKYSDDFQDFAQIKDVPLKKYILNPDGTEKFSELEISI